MCGLCLHVVPLSAQYAMGTTGLLNIPSADMQADGTFMGGGNFLPEQMMPDGWDYSTGNYFLNMTFLTFVEVAYRCTLFRGEYKAGNRWQQDRSVSVRLRPIKERKWWPSVVVGSNDVFTTNQLNLFKDPGGTRYFSSVFLVTTKHLRWGRNPESHFHDLSFTFGGHIPFRKESSRKGVFGGITYSPSYLREAVLMVEFDSEKVNWGMAICLFHHLSFHVFCCNIEAVSAGLRYEIKLF